MCRVCGSPESEPHFGGLSCRACAAFFRRYYHSKKASVKCNCKDRTFKSHPCRKCRIEKCLSIGMTPDKLQNSRDKNAVEVLQSIPSGSSTSMLEARIIPRTTTTLEFAIPCWRELEKLRFKNSCIEVEAYDFYTVSSLTKMDMDLTWDMTKKMFPSVTALKENDKDALLRNFVLKFWQLVPIFDCLADMDGFGKSEGEEYEKMIVDWYSGSFEEGKEMTKKEILRVFEPFWRSFFTQVMPPIARLKLKNEEQMAIVWLLFFDSAYTNISTECQEICGNIRKVILRELKNFQVDKNSNEMRFFATLDVLKLIEKSEEKFLVEIMICEMYNITSRHCELAPISLKTVSLTFQFSELYKLFYMCLVCGSPEAEPHFGGLSCRACAAFFRRYFNSKKGDAKCICEKKTVRSHPCRKCRIDKCLMIGMSPKKVQATRDSHAFEIMDEITSRSLSSLLDKQIISRSTSNLEFAIPNWLEFEKLRLASLPKNLEDMNIYKVTCLTKNDLDLTWKMVSNMFPSTKMLDEKDKSALLRNFFPKFWQLVPIFDFLENPDYFENMDEMKYEKMIVSWYTVEGQDMSKKEIMSFMIFEPFWYDFYARIVPPIVALNLQKEELMAIVWLLFFDNCYANLTSECQEMCRDIKKVILRELRNFQASQGDDEMRFFDALDALGIVEKSEIKFMEEILMCEMHNVKIHDDFKDVINESRL